MDKRAGIAVSAALLVIFVAISVFAFTRDDSQVTSLTTPDAISGDPESTSQLRNDSTTATTLEANSNLLGDSNNGQPTNDSDTVETSNDSGTTSAPGSSSSSNESQTTGSPTKATAPASDSGPDLSKYPRIVEVAPPGTNLAALAKDASPGTRFVLAEGTYSFEFVDPADRVAIVGQGPGKTVVNGSGKSVAIFGDSDEVLVAGIEFANFNKPVNDNPQNQAAVAANTVLYSAPITRGSYWTIDNILVYGGPGSGVNVGDHTTLTNSEFRDNAITGIGGGGFVGGLVKGNLVYNNGSVGAAGQFVNNAGVKFGFVNETDQSSEFVFTENTVRDNGKRGVWCDLDCRNVTISNNKISNHETSCIYFEISGSGTVEDNTLDRCMTHGKASFLHNWAHGAITVGSSSNIDVRNNTISNSPTGISIDNTVRPSNEPWLVDQVAAGRVPIRVSKNVNIENNTLINVQNAGTGHSDSTPSSQLFYETLNFSNNDYSQSPNIALWFNRQQYSLDNWPYG